MHLCAGALWDNVCVSVLSVFVGVLVGVAACVFEYVCVCLAVLCVCRPVRV